MIARTSRALIRCRAVGRARRLAAYPDALAARRDDDGGGVGSGLTGPGPRARIARSRVARRVVPRVCREREARERRGGQVRRPGRDAYGLRRSGRSRSRSDRDGAPRQVVQHCQSHGRRPAAAGRRAAAGAARPATRRAAARARAAACRRVGLRRRAAAARRRVGLRRRAAACRRVGLRRRAAARARAPPAARGARRARRRVGHCSRARTAGKEPRRSGETSDQPKSHVLHSKVPFVEAPHDAPGKQVVTALGDTLSRESRMRLSNTGGRRHLAHERVPRPRPGTCFGVDHHEQRTPS